MVEIGYTLSSEEFGPDELVRFAGRAERAGFSYALISDHFHPWTPGQGSSPFVWSVLGGIAGATETLRVGTGVTCPIKRMHPAIVAHAAATAGAMMPDRFFLGVGTGELLNEHVVGGPWPEAPVRLEMLEEAVDVIRRLWRGGTQSYHGAFFTVENARIFNLPDPPPPIYMAAVGDEAATTAGRISDGLISTAPSREVVETFERAGGRDKPRFAQIHVCWGKDEREARRAAHERWPISGLPGVLNTELALPQHFEALAPLSSEQTFAEQVPCGPDAQRHIDGIREYVRAGFDHVYVHQIGPDQEGFFEFYEREVLPAFREERRRAAG